MYFVFKDDVKAWHNQILQAQIQGEAPPPHIQNQWWKSEPLHNPLLDLKFAINAKAPLLDSFFTG